MKFAIKHEIKGRIRIHLAQKHMTYRQADILQCYLEKQANILSLIHISEPTRRS